ncbi:hypothetical protein FHS31_003231 [Sphingomonas vulcanisoli]|uniref:Uncharacterized protein n=1 Tax=Sphingomonas vulcanisoli TaxID=1658060 RepID=A0ABX0TVM8_9SPHN|nr:hypothetical protein [Sphingomonas vulcanisoli]NIJ09594.1 hypothetical protein [Sphingomonas vulcanisoli]
MSDRWYFAAFTVFCVGVFAYGIRTGRMPAKISSFDRRTQPTLFKIAGGSWLLFAAIGAWVAVTMP